MRHEAGNGIHSHPSKQKKFSGRRAEGVDPAHLESINVCNERPLPTYRRKDQPCTYGYGTAAAWIAKAWTVSTFVHRHLFVGQQVTRNTHRNADPWMCERVASAKNSDWVMPQKVEYCLTSLASVSLNVTTIRFIENVRTNQFLLFGGPDRA